MDNCGKNVVLEAFVRKGACIKLFEKRIVVEIYPNNVRGLSTDT